jgi:hypothetical protein
MVGLYQNPDLVATRRLRRAATPTLIALALLCVYLAIRAFSIGDLFELILVQMKGGSSLTETSELRLRSSTSFCGSTAISPLTPLVS